MKLQEQIDWINKNRGWIETLEPLSLELCWTGEILIHADYKGEGTEQFFKENKKNAIINPYAGGKYYCKVKKDNLQVTTFFTKEEVRQILWGF